MPFEDFQGDDDYPEKHERLIRDSWVGSRVPDKKIAYKGRVYWIWKDNRELRGTFGTPPTRLRAIVKNAEGGFSCFEYTAPGCNDCVVPFEAIVTRMEETGSWAGRLEEIV